MLNDIGMERGATVQSEGESVTDGEDVVFNPADDSSSSCEASSTIGNERQEAATFEDQSSTIRRWHGNANSIGKITSSTPAVTSSDSLQPCVKERVHAKTIYSD